MGAMWSIVINAFGGDVSIRAPVMGAMGRSRWRRATHEVSIRAPVMGAMLAVPVLYSRLHGVSIRAPVMGAIDVMPAMAVPRMFQSAPP